jgi:hypothetical protein
MALDLPTKVQDSNQCLLGGVGRETRGGHLSYPFPLYLKGLVGLVLAKLPAQQ